MKPTRLSACVFAVAASLAGCMATSEVEYAGSVRVTSPELVTISPGVQVIADADEPLFYSRGYYWLYRDGFWFRSDSYRSGFARIDTVYLPGELRVIERPQLYVQYRRHIGRDRFARPGNVQTRTQTYQTPTYQEPQPEPQQTYPNSPAPAPGQPLNPGQEHHGTTPSPLPPDIDHTTPQTTTPAAPPNRPMTPPGQTNRPDDHGNRPDERGNPNAPGNRPDDRGNRPDDRGPGAVRQPPSAAEHEHGNQDRDDRGTPPAAKDKTKKKAKY